VKIELDEELKAIVAKLGGEAKLEGLDYNDLEGLRLLKGAPLEQLDMFCRYRRKIHRQKAFYDARMSLLEAAQTLDAFNVATQFALVHDDVTSAKNRAAEDYCVACKAWLEARKALEEKE
jgi:hypothetical protein